MSYIDFARPWVFDAHGIFLGNFPGQDICGVHIMLRLLRINLYEVCMVSRVYDLLGGIGMSMITVVYAQQLAGATATNQLSLSLEVHIGPSNN